ncbi:Nucleotidyltransferase [Candidatus Magnetomoraceae bacterium gMMP-15]
MNRIIDDKIEIINSYCKQYDVERLFLFGSITSNHFTKNSDIDMLIKFKSISTEKYSDNYFILHDLFEKTFNRKVDLVTEKSLSNPYFIKRVNQTKVLIYEE